MKKVNFTGRKSLPVDFAQMTVNDLALALEIINSFYEDAEKKDRVIQRDFKKVTVPLKLLAKVFGVEYSINISRTTEIEKTLSEIMENINALCDFEETFFQRIKESFQKSEKKPKTRKIGLVERKAGVYVAG